MSAGLDLKRIWEERPLLRLLAGLFLIVVGVLLSKIPVMIINQGWPSTEGIILKRTLLAKKFKEYDGDYYTHYEGFIRYQYDVAGTVYTSTAVNAIDTPYFPYETALRYPKGKEVRVYYNPRDPAQAVLEPGLVFSSEALGFFPSLIILGGVYLLAREGFKTIQKHKKEPDGSTAE